MMCGWDDWAFEESGAVINEVGEAVWIDSSVDLLDDCAFDLVARFERFGVVAMELSACGHLGCRSGCQVWEYRIDWSNEGDSGGDAMIGVVAAD